MNSLREKFSDSGAFVCGVELVSTRGTMAERHAQEVRDFANELAKGEVMDWASITDNAGGNPMLSPVALGKPLLYAGKEVVIHLSGKDLNRSSIESTAWQLASEGFHNILALSGDYPASGGYRGQAKPVFDIDSVGIVTLLAEMNQGMRLFPKKARSPRRLKKTDFLVGTVVSSHKRHENELIPQYYKLIKKIECGSQFIINQIGYNAAKDHELIAYMNEVGYGPVPLIGNVYLLNRSTARFFNAKKLPGVVLTDAMLDYCDTHAGGSDNGNAFFLELAAKQMAIYRGLGYRGVYFGGVECVNDLNTIVDIEKTFGADDWQQFAAEIQYPQPNEFFYYARDTETGLVDPTRLNPDYEASRRHPKRFTKQSLSYAFGHHIHDQVFTPGKPLNRLARAVYTRSRNPRQGPAPLRTLEHITKAALFQCRDCGDCSLPDIAFLCPESQCAKNQRNGPCGGTQHGMCEVDNQIACIWAKAYDRLKYHGRESTLLDHAPVIQDQALRGTSSWANAVLMRDHHGPAGDAHREIVTPHTDSIPPKPAIDPSVT